MTDDAYKRAGSANIHWKLPMPMTSIIAPAEAVINKNTYIIIYLTGSWVLKILKKQHLGVVGFEMFTIIIRLLYIVRVIPIKTMKSAELSCTCTV